MCHAAFYRSWNIQVISSIFLFCYLHQKCSRAWKKNNTNDIINGDDSIFDVCISMLIEMNIERRAKTYRNCFECLSKWTNKSVSRAHSNKNDSPQLYFMILCEYFRWKCVYFVMGTNKWQRPICNANESCCWWLGWQSANVVMGIGSMCGRKRESESEQLKL